MAQMGHSEIPTGFSGDLGNGISWDVGALYYAYPDQSEDDGPGVGDFDFWEVYGGLSYTFDAVDAGFRIGSGQLIPDRLHRLRRGRD